MIPYLLTSSLMHQNNTMNCLGPTVVDIMIILCFVCVIADH